MAILARTTTSSLAFELRNGVPTERVEQLKRDGEVISEIAKALMPLQPESRARVLRAVCALLDIDINA